MWHKCKVIMYLAIFLSVAILVTGATPSTTSPNFGEMKNKIYKNKYFDLQFVIPKGVKYLSRDVIEESLNRQYELMLQNNEATVEEINLAKKRRMTMFQIENNTKTLSIDAFCADIECLQGQDLNSFLENKMALMVMIFEENGYKSDLITVNAKEKLGKYEYLYSEVQAVDGDVTYKFRNYARIKGKYLININIIYTKNEEIKELIKAFK